MTINRIGDLLKLTLAYSKDSGMGTWISLSPKIAQFDNCYSNNVSKARRSPTQVNHDKEKIPLDTVLRQQLLRPA